MFDYFERDKPVSRKFSSLGIVSANEKSSFVSKILSVKSSSKSKNKRKSVELQIA